MPARNGHSSETAEAGGGSPQEPLIDRQLELDLLRQHIARVADTGKGHAVPVRSWPASAKSSPKAHSASGESTKNYHASSSRPPPETQACFSWSMTCMRLTRTP